MSLTKKTGVCQTLGPSLTRSRCGIPAISDGLILIMSLLDSLPITSDSLLRQLYEDERILSACLTFLDTNTFPDKVMPTIGTKFPSAARALVASAARNKLLPRGYRLVAALLMFYFAQHQDDFDDEPLVVLARVIAQVPVLEYLFAFGQDGVDNGIIGLLDQEIYEIMDAFVARPIVVFADTQSFNDHTNEVVIDESAYPVDWSLLENVLSLDIVQEAEYVTATANGDIARIAMLEGSSAAYAATTASPFDSFLTAVRSDGFWAEILSQSSSMVLKIWGTPKALVNDVMDALRKPQASIILAYVANHVPTRKKRMSFLISTGVVCLAQTYNRSSLSITENCFVTKAAYMRSYVSIWALPSHTGPGIGLSKSMSRLITTLRTQIWGNRNRHKCLFTSNTPSPGEISGFDLHQVFEHHTSGEQLCAAVAEKLNGVVAGHEFQVNPEGRVTPGTHNPHGYIFLFTWDRAFHQHCTDALIPYLRALKHVKAVKSLSIDPPKLKPKSRA